MLKHYIHLKFLERCDVKKYCACKIRISHSLTNTEGATFTFLNSEPNEHLETNKGTIKIGNCHLSDLTAQFI